MSVKNKNGETRARTSFAKFVQQRKTQVAKWNTKQSVRILLEGQEHIRADFRAEIQKHEFQVDSDWRSLQELTGIIESQRKEIDPALAGDERLRRDQRLLHEQITRTKSGSSCSSYEVS